MEQQKMPKFYQTKAFRSIIAVVLAVILLSNSAVENMSSLFATEGEPAQTQEVSVPEQQEAAPTADPEAGDNGENRSAEPPQETAVPDTHSAPDAGEVTVTEGSEDGVEPTEEATEPTEEATEAPSVEPTAEAPALDPIAEAIAASGAAYLRVEGDIFSSIKMKEDDKLGRLVGIVLATAFHEAVPATETEAEKAAAIEVVYADAEGLQKGFMSPAAAQLLGYDATIEEIGENALQQYQSAAWPLPAVEFEAVVVATPVPEVTAAPEAAPFIVGFVGVEDTSVPMQTIEVETTETLDSIDLPESLTVLLSDDSTFELPVAWEMESGEIVAGEENVVSSDELTSAMAVAEKDGYSAKDASSGTTLGDAVEIVVERNDGDEAVILENETIDEGEQIRLEPTWDKETLVLGDRVGVPFIVLNGVYTPMGGGPGGTLEIRSEFITQAQTTYDIAYDTQTRFQVRYNPPTGGTLNTILIVNCLEYGAMFNVAPISNNVVNSACIINPTTVAVLLQNGITNEAVIDFKMDFCALTQANAITWMDTGSLPATQLKAKAITGTLNTTNNTYTQTSELASVVYGTYTPKNYAGPASFTKPVSYKLHVPSIGAMTDHSFVFNSSADTAYLTYFSGDTPYYAYNYPTLGFKSSLSGTEKYTPLIEITGMKIYVPSPKLMLASLGSTSSGAYYYSANNYFTNWTISARKTDDPAGDYYIITPPARLFNGTDNSQLLMNLAATLRPQWALISQSNELGYSANAYTNFQSTKPTQLMYQIPSGTSTPTKYTVDSDAALVMTYAREAQEKMSIIPNVERKKNNSGLFNYGTTGNTSQFVAMLNAYATTTTSGVRKELTPAHTGEVVETYEFPHEVQPTNMYVGSAYYSNNNAALSKDTSLKSVVVEYQDGSTSQLDATALSTLNNILKNGYDSSAVPLRAASATTRITKITVTWNKVVTSFWNYTWYNSFLSLTLAGVNWGYGSYLFEEYTKFSFDIPTNDPNGTKITQVRDVQVKYTNSRKNNVVAGNTWDLADYLWFHIEPPVVPVQYCPTLYGYPYSTSYLGNTAFHADNKTEYNAGSVWIQFGTATNTISKLVNPVVDIFANCKLSYYGTHDSNAITNMNAADSIGFLSGKFTTSRYLAGWKISYSTNRGARPAIQLPATMSGDMPIDLDIDCAGGEYLTSLKFSYTGDYTLPIGSTTQIYFMSNVMMFGWNKNFTNGQPIQYGSGASGRFHVRLQAQASWDNCDSYDNGKHDVNVAGPQAMLPYSNGYFPGVMFFLYREVTLNTQSIAMPVNYQSIYQGSPTKPETYANFTHYAYAQNMVPGTQTFTGSQGDSNYYVPWGIDESIFIELTDPEFVFNPATTSVFGVPVGPYLTADQFTANGKNWLKLTLKAGYQRNSYFKSTGFVHTGYGSGSYYNSLGGSFQIGFTSVPGCRLGFHYPMGKVYFDYSQLLQDYTAPAKPNSNDITKDFPTKWNISSTVADTNGISSTSVTGPKLREYDFSSYKVDVMQATALAATLVPGLNGVYQFVDRKVEFNGAQRSQLDALVAFTASDDMDVYNFTSYVILPRNGKGIKYNDTMGAEQTATSQYDMNLRSAPVVLADSTAMSSGNLTFAYTTDANPSDASSYTTTAPTTTAGWAAVTAIRVRAATLPKSSAINMRLPLSAPVKTTVGNKNAYIGGTYAYETSSTGGNPYKAKLQLGTYVYKDYLVTSGGGFVYFDVMDENGNWYGSTSYERYPTANEVTVTLYDTDGTTVIDSTTVSPTDGRFNLSSYKGDAGQIIKITMPTTGGGTYKLTKKSTSVFTSTYYDSDFDRDTNSLTLPALTANGFLNISAGIVRLPEITAPDVTVKVGLTANQSAKLTDYYYYSMPTTSYNLAFSAAANTTIATPYNGQTLPYTHVITGSPAESTGTTVTNAVKGLAVGTTTATITTTNTLGDVVSKTYNITVESSEVDVVVTKNWADSSNAPGVRPANIQIQLYRKVGSGTATAVGSPVAMTGTATAASWTYTFSKQAEFDGSGNTYTYSVDEVTVPTGYTKSVNGLTITNTLETVDVTVTKVWDIKGTGFTKPASVTVNLYANGTLSKTQAVTGSAGANTWTYTWTNLPKYGSGGQITYTVDEPSVPTGIDKTVSGMTITNTYRADVSKNVEVVWVHTGAPAATRTAVESAGVTINLLRNSAAYKSQAMGTANSWKHTFAVPYLDTLSGATFSITQSAVSGYTTTYSTKGDGTMVATNTYVMPKITVSGTKTWLNVPTGMAKPTVQINLLRNSVQFDTTTITGGGTSYSFANLDTYDASGVAYVYTTNETAVAGYTTTQSGYNITNTYSPKTAEVDALFTKTVTTNVGAPDETFSFTMVGSSGSPMPTGASGQSKTITAKAGAVNFGKITFTLPGTYTYTVTETAGSTEGFTYDNNSYTMTVVVADTAGVLGTSVTYKKGANSVANITLANTYAIPTRSVVVTLFWDDNSNTLGGRPTAAPIQLYRTPAGGTRVAVGSVVNMTGTGTAASWTYTFNTMPVHSTDGKEYTYSVEQTSYDKNYTVSYNPNSTDTKIALSIKDKLNTISISGKKIWDIKGTGYTKPSSVNIDVYRNNVNYRTVNVPAVAGNDEWSYTVANLLQYDATGTAYAYSVKETTPIAGIDASVSGYNITNTYRANSDQKVKVVWVHTGAPAATRTTVENAGVTINLLRNSAAYKTQAMGTTNSWQHTFSIPYLDSMGTVAFSITQSAVSGYTTTYSSETDGTLVATNTYVMPKISVIGTKVWVGVPIGMTKPTVEIVLKRNGTQFQTTNITGGGTSYSFANLDTYDASGVAYTYTTSETPVAGFTTTQSGLTITNTYDPTKAEVDVVATKNVTAGVGAPNDQFTFTLTAASGTNPMPTGAVGNVLTKQATVGSVNFGKISFSLPGTYVYTIAETAGTTEGFTYDNSTYTMTVVVSGTSSLTAVATVKKGVTSVQTMDFMNVYAVPTRTLSGTLTWVDNNNSLSGRPASAQVQLYRIVDGGTRQAVGSVVSATVAAGNVWSYTFGAQPVHDNTGKTYTYSVEQVNVDKNYTSTVSGLNLTDTLKTISITGQKVWNIQGTGFTKPSKVEINLYRNGGSTAYRVIEVSPASNPDVWSYTIDNLLEYDLTGTKYAYTVDEKTQMFAVTSSVSGTTITNTYGTDATKKIEVTWDHTGAPMTDRPTSVTINLIRNGAATPYASKAVDSTTSWKHTFNVPQVDFKDATFTITENSLLPNYATTYTTNGDTLVAHNVYQMPKVTVTGTKTWSGTPTGLAKPTAQINLLRNGTKVQDTTIVNGGTTYSFTNLDKYDPSGVAYTYTVTEEDVPGYEKSQTGNNFTNTYNPTKASVNPIATKSVTQGVGAPDEEFTFTLTAGNGANPMPSGSTAGVKSIQAKAGSVNFGTMDFSLPGTYTYTVAETAASTEGFTYDSTVYTLTVSVSDTNGVLSAVADYKKGSVSVQNMTFSNTYVIPTRTLSGTLTWVDSNNTLNGRPASAQVQLYRIIDGGTRQPVGSVVSATVVAGNVWNYTFGAQPVHDTAGKTYTYSVEQVNVDKNYTSTVSGLNLTDTLKTISVSGQKVWNIQGTGFTKPSKVEINLYRNGGSTAYRVIEVSPDSNPDVWAYTIDNLLEYDLTGTKYVYTVDEKTQMFAVTSAVSGTTITNTYGTDATKKIKVTWDHTGAPASMKPTTVTINLIRNGAATPYASQAVTATTSWQHTFNVPQVDFKDATFTITENSLLPNYTTTYTTEGDTLVAHNVFVMPKVTVEGSKTWVGTPSGVNVPAIEINLLRNGTEIQDITLASGTTTYKFENLPKYDNGGNEYTYTVSEEDVPGYDEAKTGYAFTNTYNPTGASISVLASKTVTQNVGAPADKFSFTLTAGKSGNPMPSNSNGDTKTVEAPAGSVGFGTINFTLPGVYVYTITETAGSTAGFTYDPAVFTLTVTVTDNNGVLQQTSSMTKTVGGVTTNVTAAEFANAYAVPTEDKVITINWVDNSDVLGGRPASTSIKLYRQIPGGQPVLVSGTAVTVPAVAGQNTWTHTYDDMPVHDNDGKVYTYSVVQENLDKNYTEAIAGLVITNTIVTIEKTGTKTWAIVGNGFTPIPIDVQLYRNNVIMTGKVQTLASKPGLTWSYTFKDLLRYDKSGTEYTYTAKEVEVPFGCEVSYSGMNITNTYGADELVPVRVEWDYTGAPETDKHSSVTITLFRDGIAASYDSATVSASGNWKYSFPLPRVDHIGQTFSITQNSLLPRWTTTYYTDDDDVLVAKNVYNMPEVEVSGTKTWKDTPDGLAKPTVTVKLIRNGNAAAPIATTTIVSPATTYKFDKLPKYDATGNTYTYTVAESDILGYDEVQSGTNFTNTYKPAGAAVTVTGSKAVTKATYAPDDEFTFVLTATDPAFPMPTGSTAGAKTIQAKAGSIEFGDISFTLPGTYTYTITETAGTTRGFTYDNKTVTMTIVVTDPANGTLSAATSFAPGGNTFSFANAYTIPTDPVTITVNWIDNSDALQLRPDETTVQLYRAIPGGQPVAITGTNIAVSGTGDSWTHTFPNMPIYDDNGKTYTYTVGQENLDENYDESISGLVITNTIKEAGVSIKKTAKPAPEKAGETAAVKAGDTIVYTIEVKNTGSRSVYDVRVMDTIPAGLTVGACSPMPTKRFDNADGSTTLIWRVLQIGKNASANIIVPVTVKPLAAGENNKLFSNIAYYRIPETDDEELTDDPDEPDDPENPDKPYTPTDDPVEHQLISLTKTANPASGSAQDASALVEGQVVTYTLKLNVLKAASGIVVKDVIPTGMTFVPGSITTTGAVNGTYDAGTRTVTWPSQTIAAPSVTMTFKAQVNKFTAAEIAAGTFTKTLKNTASATITHKDGTTDSTTPSNDVEHLLTRREVTFGSKEVALVENGVVGSYQQGTAQTPVETELGQTVSYKLTVNSTGYMPRGSVTVEDTLHPDVTFVAGSTTVTPASAASKVTLTKAPSAANGNKATWTITDLGVDEDIVIEFRATAPTSTDNLQTTIYETAKTFTNTATLTDEGLKDLKGDDGKPVYNDPDEYTETSNTTYNAVYESELVAHKTSDPISPKANGDIVVMEAGDLITYTIEVVNTGDEDAIKPRVMDILPAGVEFVESKQGPTPLVFEEDGVTTLMWEIPKLVHADRQTGEPNATAGIVKLVFTVRVLVPDQARLIDNVAYYRLSAENEPFPAFPGKPDDKMTYNKTREVVRHQVYRFWVETDPAGGLTPATAAQVKPGDTMEYRAIFEAAYVIHNIKVTDVVPSGITPVPGTIKITLPNGQVIPVLDSAYNPTTRIITWPTRDVTAGRTVFSVTLVVDPLDVGDKEEEYETGGEVTTDDGDGGETTTPTPPTYFETNLGFANVEKTAALVVGGVVQADNAGTPTSPVLGDRGQQVEYTLTVTRDASAKNVSGEIIVTDALPSGMSLVDGTISGSLSGAGQIVSMTGKQVTDINGVRKPGVEWVIKDMKDDEVATLKFRAKLPDFADDPDTTEVESERIVINTARMVDVDIRDMVYTKPVPGHSAGEHVYPVTEFDKPTNPTYHNILGAVLSAVLTSNIQIGTRVNAGDVVTYTIAVSNTGAIGAIDVLVRDTLPGYLKYIVNSQTSDKPGTEFQLFGSTLAWIIPEIGVGETVYLTFQAQVTEMADIGSRLLINGAEVTETTPGGDPHVEIRTSTNFHKTNKVNHFQRLGATIIIKKVDAATGDKLAGAEFTLHQLWAPTKYDRLDTDWTVTSNGEGEAIFTDVPLGKYVVTETRAPEGYMGSKIQRSVDITGILHERSIVVPNWSLTLENMEVGVPNAGAGSRNVGDCPQ